MFSGWNWRRGVSEWCRVYKEDSNYGTELCLLGHSEALNWAPNASTLRWPQLPRGPEMPMIRAVFEGLQMDRIQSGRWTIAADIWLWG
jgi:hypothetical protein